MSRLRLKHIVRINEQTLPETTDPSFEFRYIEIGAIGRGELTDDPLVMTFADSPSRARRLVRDGDTIISTVRTYLRAVWPVRGSRDDLVVSTGFAVLTPGLSVDSRYLGWLAQSDVVVEEVVARSVGVSYPAINPNELGDVRVPLPAIHEQRATADYLDAETSRIDALIEKKRRMIELLESAVVTRIEKLLCGAATSSTPLRRLLAEPPQYGASESGEAGEIDWPRYIRITDLDPKGTLRDVVKRLPHTIARPYLLRDKDVLIARSGATVGKAFIYRTVMGPCCFAGYLVRFRFDPDKILPELVELWTRTAHYWNQIRESSLQATIENVSAERYKELLIPTPPRSEQELLLQDMDRRRRNLNEVLRPRLSRQLHLLQERRQALITAAVTGEQEVPGVAA